MKEKELVNRIKQFGFSELRFDEAPPAEIVPGKMYLFIDKNGLAEHIRVEKGPFGGYCIWPLFLLQEDIIGFRQVDVEPADGIGLTKFHFNKISIQQWNSL